MQNKYEIIGVVGEGAYGIVIKCRNKVTNEFVAIKKFKESEDEIVKKTMKRELKMLQLLKHSNVVEFKEAFQGKKDLFLVFEFVERNLLEVLQEKPAGLDHQLIKSFIYQLCKAIKYLHDQNVIHRDIKPENLLIDNEMKLKLCDFGFARKMPTKPNERLTDYVATRWYRSPELLITGETYGPEVDYWAIGCIMGELADGIALFQGNDETDQLHCIQKVLGNFPEHQVDEFYKNPLYNGKNLLNVGKPETLERRYLGKLPKIAIGFLKDLLELDPKKRLNSNTVFDHPYFDNYQDNNKGKTRKSVSQENALGSKAIPASNIPKYVNITPLRQPKAEINNNINTNSNSNLSESKGNLKVIDEISYKPPLPPHPQAHPQAQQQAQPKANINLNIINYNIYHENPNSLIPSNISNNNSSMPLQNSPLQKTITTLSKDKIPPYPYQDPSKLSQQSLPLELTISKFPKMPNQDNHYSNPHSNKNQLINSKKQFTLTTRTPFNFKPTKDFSLSTTSLHFNENKKNISVYPSNYLPGMKTFFNNTNKSNSNADQYNFSINTQFKKYPIEAPVNTARMNNCIIDEEVEFPKEEKKKKSRSQNPSKKQSQSINKLSMYYANPYAVNKKNHFNYANSSCYGQSFTRGGNFQLPALGNAYKRNNNFKKSPYYY